MLAGSRARRVWLIALPLACLALLGQGLAPPDREWTAARAESGSRLFLPFTVKGLDFAPFGPRLRPIGRLGGPVWAVEVRSTLAYVALGGRIEVLDLAEPELPQRVGASPPIAGGVWDMVADGPYLYAVGGRGLTVLSIADQRNPQPVASAAADVEAGALAVYGSRAFLASGENGLIIVNIADPLRPVEISQYRGEGGSYEDRLEAATDVAINGNVAFVANNDDFGLWVVDVGNPARPRRLAMSSQQDGVAVAATRDHVYQLDNDSGLTVYTRPSPGAIAMAGGASIRAAHDLALAEGRLAVAADRKLLFYDLQDPAHPVLADESPLFGEGIALRWVGKAYVASGHGGLELVDLGTRTCYCPAFNPASSPVAVEALGDRAFLGSSDPPELAVVDLSEPGHPGILGRTSLPATPIRLIAHPDGERVFAALGGAGFAVMDVRNPAEPQLAELVDTPGFARGLALLGDRLYVADGITEVDGVTAGRVHIYDIRADVPALLGSFATPVDAVGAITAAGLYAYPADSTGMVVADAGDPANTRLLRTVPGYLVDLVAARWRLAALEQGQLRLHSLADPEDPRWTGALPIPSGAGIGQRVRVAGGYAYLGTTGGLLAMDIRNIAAPAWTDQRIWDSVMDLATTVPEAGNRGLVIAATWSDGLWVFETQP